MTKCRTILPVHDLGLKTDELFGEFFQCDTWDVERVKSSKIEIIPSYNNIIVKKKDRGLDATVIETFATLFLSKLLEMYTEKTYKDEIVFHAPQVVRLQYGDQNKKEANLSVVYQTHCPGSPLNKVDNRRTKTYTLRGKQVCKRERIYFLVGAIGEIFRREGVMHGDPHLRHFFYLPKAGKLPTFKGDKRYTKSPSGKVLHKFIPYNGLGLIDLEKLRLSYDSIKVEKDISKFQKRVISKFPVRYPDKWIRRGADYIKSIFMNESYRHTAYTKATNMLTNRFEGYITHVDLFKKRVSYRNIK